MEHIKQLREVRETLARIEDGIVATRGTEFVGEHDLLDLFEGIHTQVKDIIGELHG